MINPVDYLAIKARVREEFDNINLLEAKLKKAELFPEITAAEYLGLPLNDENVCRIIGSILHDYYNVLENIFEHLLRSFGESLPVSEQWHKELLKKASLEIPGVRPAFISKQTELKLDDLRKFRHVIRNIYGFNINSEKEQVILKMLPDISLAVRTDINYFFEQMDILILE